jgi:two-component system CheB/CheR fusion protein
MAVVRDATEQVRMLEEVRAAKRAAEEMARVKGEFLGFAAHDLSQPVQTLELMINAIEQRARESSEFAELSAFATISVARMRELLRMLLEISRLDSGALQVHEEPVQIAEIFAYLERQFGPIARAKALDFVTEPSSHLVEADPTLLRGMLSNLVSNAIRYTPRGEVRLQSGVGADGALSLAVRDTGIGIRTDQLQTIFQDFRRLEEAERMAGEGFGLGLGIVRRLSSLLRFSVTVQSSVARGSTFRVDIPAAKVYSRA